jgi:hypothetical protein
MFSYRRTRILVAFAIVYCLSVSCSIFAHVSKDTSDQLIQTITKELSSQFNDLSGYELSATRTLWQNPELIRSLRKPPLESKLSLIVLGAKFYLNDQTAFGPEGAEFFRIATYDREYYQVLRTQTGYLYITKTSQPPREYFRRYLDEYLRPLEFFSELTKDDDSKFTILEDLKKRENWELFSKRIKKAEYVTIFGKKIARFEVESGIEYSTNQKSHYVVLADPANSFFPIQWERIADETAKPIYVYRIIEVGCKEVENKKIYFPMRAELNFHGGVGNQASYSNTPRSKITIITKKIIFNPIVDNDKFIIDPSVARHIWDDNVKTLITVPK